MTMLSVCMLGTAVAFDMLLRTSTLETMQLANFDQKKGCFDDNAKCPGWAGSGECTKNPAYMEKHCRLSCKICQRCVDYNTKCPGWADKDECTKNPVYMEKYCRLSCKICQPTPTTTAAETTAAPVAPGTNQVGPRTAPIQGKTDKSVGISINIHVNNRGVKEN